MTRTRRLTREAERRRFMLSRSILGRPPSPSPSPLGSDSSDEDSSVSLFARKPSVRDSSRETTPDHSNASTSKSSDSESSSSLSQRSSKVAEEGEDTQEDGDDEAEPGPDDLDEPWEYTFQVCFRVPLLL